LFIENASFRGLNGMESLLKNPFFSKKKQNSQEQKLQQQLTFTA
jgi:hypothetical protein